LNLAAEDGVTFAEYPPKGWVGYCATPGCAGDKGAGEAAAAITLGYAYSAWDNYFVYYATADAFEAGAAEYTMEYVVTELSAWGETYFTWIVEAEEVEEAAGTETVSSDSISQILAGILSDPPAALTVTLLWHAAVDLDLYLACPDGSEIGYGANPGCAGQVDLDNTAQHETATRGDGSTGQTENISLGTA